MVTERPPNTSIPLSAAASSTVMLDFYGGMVRHGLTADLAVGMIYAVYIEGTCVPNIINGVKRVDKMKLYCEGMAILEFG